VYFAKKYLKKNKQTNKKKTLLAAYSIQKNLKGASITSHHRCASGLKAAVFFN